MAEAKPPADAPKVSPSTQAAMPGGPATEPVEHKVIINDTVYTWKEGEPVPAEAKDVYEASIAANTP